MTKSWRLLVVVALLASRAGAQVTGLAPRIDLSGSEATLVLPPAMKAALDSLDPTFSPRRLVDYPPWALSTCDEDRRNCKPFGKVNPREAPFAVIGDFNGDKVLDVAVDGDSTRVVIMSAGSAFTAQVVDSIGPIPPSILELRRRARTEEEGYLGVDSGLSLTRPGVVRSSFEPGPLTLKTDAIHIHYYEKASEIMYFRNGKWLRYSTSD